MLMKNVFTFILMAAAACTLQAKVYTFADLSQIEGSGVTVASDGAYVLTMSTGLTEPMSLDGGGIIVSKSDLTLADGNGLKINDGEVIKFSDKARIVMNGLLEADVQDATITATDDATGTALGIRLFGAQSKAVLKNLTMKYVGITFGPDGSDGNLVADGCTFDSFNGKMGTSNINFTSESHGNVVNNCTFTNGQVACVACGSNVPCGIDITNCVMDKNGVSGRLTPAINMGLYGSYDINIENNVVTGRAVVTRTGGIAVSHLMGGEFTGTVTIKGNTVTDNSYGITLTGPGKVIIENNVVKNNRYIASAMNGGSGINITANTGGAIARIRGNEIEGNMWGITLIGPKAGSELPLIEVDLGTATDPGLNTFKDNGNDGTNYSIEAGNLCDLYNNSGSEVYAVGNTWNVADQEDLDAIEAVIYNMNDDESLGEVIFAQETGIAEVKTAAATDGRYYDLMGRPVANPTAGIYIHQGKKVIVR